MSLCFTRRRRNQHVLVQQLAVLPLLFLLSLLACCHLKANAFQTDSIISPIRQTFGRDIHDEPKRGAAVAMPSMVATPDIASSSSKASSNKRTTMVEWQDAIASTAEPLAPTSLSYALTTLQRDGVVRISDNDLSIEAALCDALRDRVTGEIYSGNSRWGSNDNNQNNNDKIEGKTDNKYVPGTRLRFVEPVDVAFSGVARRHDLLLPIDTNEGWSEVMPVVSSAARQLSMLLGEAAEFMLPRLSLDDDKGRGTDIQEKEAGMDFGHTPSSLEVVELASLLACHGSTTQVIHGDYRRYHNIPQSSSDIEELNAVEPSSITTKRIGKLPPRLVTFVVLQDIPTVKHGATGFITGTHNARAHDTLYGDADSIYPAMIDIKVDSDDNSDEGIMSALENRQALIDLSTSNASGVRTASGFKRGDVLIYDASVLHWGGPNTVPDNDRAILYFGVARPGAAKMLDTQQESMVRMGFELAEPLLLGDVTGSR